MHRPCQPGEDPGKHITLGNYFPTEEAAKQATISDFTEYFDPKSDALKGVVFSIHEVK
jgi:hypothetical protein